MLQRAAGPLEYSDFQLQLLAIILGSILHISHKTRQNTKIDKIYSLRPSVAKTYSFFSCPTVAESFPFLAKYNNFSSLLLYSVFISLPFSFPTLLFIYLTHLTQLFFNSVPKRIASTTEGQREYNL